MNIELLKIDNIFVGTASSALSASKPNAIKEADRFSSSADINPLQVGTNQRIATDNMPTDAPNEPTNKLAEKFSHTLGKIVDETTHEAQGNTKSNKQDLESEVLIKENTVQPLVNTELTTLVSALATELATNKESKTGRQLSQLIINLKAEKSTPLTGHAAKSAEIKLLLSTGEKQQLGLKTVLPPKSNGQIGLKTILPNSSKSKLTANEELVKAKKTDKISMLNKPADTTKAFINGEKVKILTPEVLARKDSKTTAAGEKTAMAGASEATGSQKAPTLSAKKLIIEASIDSSTKTTQVAEKTTELNTNFPSVQNKSSASQSQLVGISPEKSALTAEKQTNNKAVATEILSESTSGNAEDSPRAGKNQSGDYIAQKLNITDVQISTNKTKNNNNLAHNNSNSHFEQIFSHNESQTPITEQSPTSAQGAKTSNLPGQSSSNDVSADIGKQILESIHNSLSQQSGDRQITVRLNPPELGKVFIKFHEQEAQITGLLEVSRTQTRADIEQALPQIIRNLQDCGIQIKRLEVVLSNGEQSDQQALRDQSLNTGADQQQDSANPGSWGSDLDTSGIYEWLTDSNSYLNLSGLQESLITDGSINMLV